MGRFVRAAVAACALVAAGTAGAAAKDYAVVTLAEGVHGFVWKDPLQDPIEGNALFIVNDRDVVVVDSGLLPSSARAMASELRKLTPKPVRYVVNTHWHDDHINGNGVYRELFPGVEFIAHTHTRTDAIEQSMVPRPDNIANMEKTAEKYERWVATGKDDDGKPLAEERKARAAEIVGLMRSGIPELRAVVDVPPDLTFEDHLVLRRGDRTVEIRWLGLGNTRGDVVVFLPKERIVATGDLLVWPIPFMFGSYYDRWIETLGRLDALPVDTLFLSHGAPQRSRDYLREVQGLLAAIVEQAKAAAATDLPVEEAKTRVDLKDWKEKFAGADPKRQRAFDAFVVAPAVERAIRQARKEPAAFTQKLR